MSVVQTVQTYTVTTETYDIKSSTEVPIPPLPNDEQIDHAVVRPPIDYSSVGAFFRSSWRRFLSLWTRRFMLSLLFGQIVSLCITCTNVTTEELNLRNWQLPTTQTFFLYFSLFVTYTPYTIYRYGFNGWFKMLYKDSWKYILLAACDVEGNFLVVKAYQYTTLLSCMLLDA
jgi:solute carrier family 35 protein F1/2